MLVLHGMLNCRLLVEKQSISQCNFFSCSLPDIDECMMAALAGEQLCMIPMMCENTEGNFDCVCPPGSEPFNNGTMCREGM